ncbi:MAG TPA: hypothetical protein VGP82_16920, partial [Ktedonobacterales bacterium]|nr:hypothetical protein [Ktedonobacterales bacterium]
MTHFADEPIPPSASEPQEDPSEAEQELGADDPYAQLVVEWLNQPSPRAERAFLEAHIDLLSPATDTVLNVLRAQYSDIRDMVEEILDHHALLNDIRRRMTQPEPIREAYLNAFGGEILDAPPWLEEAEREAAHLEHEEQHQPSSEQAARGRVGIWRAALAHADADDTLPGELRAYILTRLWNCLDDTAGDDKVRLEHEGIECLTAALAIYDRARYPRQWATVHNNLGISYAALLDGNRHANQEQALYHY